MARRILFLRLAIVFVLASQGCSPSQPSGTVTGTVKHEGEPVPTGTNVYFEQSSTGVIASSEVQSDGSYALRYQGTTMIPLGSYKVFIGPPQIDFTEKEYYALKKKVDAEYRARGEKPPPSPDWVLPAKFYTSATSPLSETVSEGENEITITLQ